MGSVDDSFRCPWCGRIGNAGYAMDGIDYPICTHGDYSCLWLQVQERLHTPESFRMLQLQSILQSFFHLFPDAVWFLVSSYLIF